MAACVAMILFQTEVEGSYLELTCKHIGVSMTSSGLGSGLVISFPLPKLPLYPSSLSETTNDTFWHRSPLLLGPIPRLVVYHMAPEVGPACFCIAPGLWGVWGAFSLLRKKQNINSSKTNVTLLCFNSWD